MLGRIKRWKKPITTLTPVFVFAVLIIVAVETLGFQIPGSLFWRDLIINLAIYLIVALSLNLEYGYAGIPNFGKVLSVAGGAYAVGFFPGRIAAWLFNIAPNLDYITYHRGIIIPQVNSVLRGNPALSLALFFATLAIAAAVGALLGLASCYPAIRLREDYLAMTLLAMGESLGLIGLYYSPLIGGTLGVAVPDLFGWSGESRYIASMLFILSISLLVLFYLERLVRTPLGRMLRAIRDNEDVAESFGKDVTRIRMRTIMISSIIAAVGGALYAFNTCNVFSPTFSRASWTFIPWVMVVLGGAANNVGVLLGTFGLISLQRFIDFYKEQLGPLVPFDVVWLYFLLLGVGIILIQMYKPEGLIQEKPTHTLSRKQLKRLSGEGEAVSNEKSESSEGVNSK